MATRCMIGIKREDGRIEAIYCHFDGYPAHILPILKEHYNTEEKVNALIALGDISSLDVNLAPVNPDVEHTFESPQPGVTVAYHRDRGDKLETVKFIGESAFRRKRGFVFNYLFKDGEWYYAYAEQD